jgi:transcriptional regulator with XRE-family HTH domain
MAETFGQRLRRLRAERGLQQADLVGPRVSISYISMLENGNREPTARVIEHLAAVLGVDAVELSGPAAAADMSEADRLALASAELLLAHGDWEGARAEFSALERSLGLPAAWGLARAQEALGQIEGALDTLERVVAGADAVGDGALIVRAHIARARCLSEQGEDVASLEAARAAVHAASEHGLEGTDEHVQAMSTLVGGLYSVGQYADAELVAADLIRLVDSGSSWRARGSAYWNAAGVAEARGDLTTAVAHSERALALLSEGDDERAWARCAVACAWFWMRHESAPQRLPEIERLLRMAGDKLRLSGTALDLAYLETEQARAALLAGDGAAAVLLAESALGRISAEQRSERATTLLVLAEARLAVEERDAARAAAEQLELTLMTLPSGRGTAITWRGLADVWKRLGNADAAYRALEEALNAQAISPSPGRAAASDRTAARGTAAGGAAGA